MRQRRSAVMIPLVKPGLVAARSAIFDVDIRIDLVEV